MAVKTIKIDEVEYVRADAFQKDIKGDRAIIVADRGWIFAGNVERKDGRIKLTNAVHVVRWESIGFDGMVENPNSDRVTLKKFPNGVDLPASSEIFCVPVDEGWGANV